MRNLLNYYTEVLGIRRVMFPKQAPETFRIIFTQELPFATPVEKEIFEKMVSAMGLGGDDYLFVPFSFGEISPFLARAEAAEIIVSFSAKIEDFLRLNFPHKKNFLISSPADMIKNPALKRGAWETLKSIIPLLN